MYTLASAISLRLTPDSENAVHNHAVVALIDKMFLSTIVGFNQRLLAFALRKAKGASGHAISEEEQDELSEDAKAVFASDEAFDNFAKVVAAVLLAHDVFPLDQDAVEDIVQNVAAAHEQTVERAVLFLHWFTEHGHSVVSGRQQWLDFSLTLAVFASVQSLNKLLDCEDGSYDDMVRRAIFSQE